MPSSGTQRSSRRPRTCTCGSTSSAPTRTPRQRSQCSGGRSACACRLLSHHRHTSFTPPVRTYPCSTALAAVAVTTRNGFGFPFTRSVHPHATADCTFHLAERLRRARTRRRRHRTSQTSVGYHRKQHCVESAFSLFPRHLVRDQAFSAPCVRREPQRNPNMPDCRHGFPIVPLVCAVFQGLASASRSGSSSASGGRARRWPLRSAWTSRGSRATRRRRQAPRELSISPRETAVPTALPGVVTSKFDIAASRIASKYRQMEWDTRLAHGWHTFRPSPPTRTTIPECSRPGC